MRTLAFRETGNLDCIRDWILGLREPFDKNNKGETEADNLGQALFLLSLVSNTNHPLVARDAANDKLFSFTLTGSKTGADGDGLSDARFVSKSGRVVIETNDWNVTYSLSLGGINPLPEKFIAKWSVEPRFVDEFVSPGVKDLTTETTVAFAQGLPNTKHTLELSGSGSPPIAAIRVYRPALAADSAP